MRYRYSALQTELLSHLRGHFVNSQYKKGSAIYPNSQSAQLPDGLIAQVVEQSTGIGEPIMGSNPVQA